MVACRVRHAGVPAVGYGVPILPKCLEGEASFLSEVRVSDVGAVGESALVQTRVCSLGYFMFSWEASQGKKP